MADQVHAGTGTPPTPLTPLTPSTPPQELRDLRHLQMLGLGRWLIAAVLLAHLVQWGATLWNVTLPASLWDPLPFARLWDAPPGQAYVVGLWWMGLLAAAGLLLGLWTRASTCLAAVTALLLGTITMSFGKVMHSSHPLIVALALMAFSDWGAAWSLDAAWARRKGRLPRVSGLPARLAETGVLAVWGVYYLFSAAFKAMKDFAEPGHMSSFLRFMQDVTQEIGSDAPAWQATVVDWLAAHEGLCWLLALGSLVLEAGVIAGVLAGRLRVASLAAIVVLHCAIGVLTPLRFFAQSLTAVALLLPAVAAVLPRHNPRLVPVDVARGLHPAATLGLAAAMLGVLLAASYVVRGDNGDLAVVMAVVLALHQALSWMTGFWTQAILLVAGSALLAGMLGWLARDAWRIVRAAAPDGAVRTLLYDGGCGFCRRWCDWAARRTGQAVRYEPCQTAVDLRRRAAIPDAECLHAAFFVEERDGVPVRIERGAGAINAVLERFPGPHRLPWRVAGLAYRLQGVRQAEDLGYRMVAKNRHRLGDDACSLPDGSSAAARPPTPPT